MPAKKFQPSLPFEDENVRQSYRLVTDVVQFGLYLQYALHQYKTTIQRQNSVNMAPELKALEGKLLEDSLIRMKKNAKKAVALVDGVSELSLDIVKLSVYPRVVELCWILGKHKKALKHAGLQLEIVRDVGMATFCQSCLGLPEVFVALRSVDRMRELVALLDRFSILKDVGALNNKCKTLLAEMEREDPATLILSSPSLSSSLPLPMGEEDDDPPMAVTQNDSGMMDLEGYGEF